MSGKSVQAAAASDPVRAVREAMQKMREEDGELAPELISDDDVAQNATSPDQTSHRTPDPAVERKANDKPQHSKRLRRMAQELGMSDDEIDDLTPDALEETVYQLTRQVLRARQEVGREAALQRDPASQTPAQATTGATTEATTEATTGEEYDFGTDLSHVDESILQALKKLGKEVVEARKIKSELDRLRQSHQSEAVRKLDEALDAEFSKYPSIFGKGSGHQLAKDSPELERRRLVYAKLGELVQKGQQTTLDQDVARLVKIIFGANAGQSPPSRSEETPEYPATPLLRPTQRHGSQELAGPARARRAVQEWQREHSQFAEENGEFLP